MVIGSGRHRTCQNCGRLFPEGDCRTPYCRQKCREEAAEKRKAIEAQIQAEIDKNKPQPPIMYYI